MKKIYYLAIIVFFFSATASAQYNLGIATGNWSGLNSLYINPANIADCHERFVIDLFSVNAGLDNSLGTINSSGGVFGIINDGNTNNIFNYSNSNKFSMLAPYAQVRLPGIMVSINHKHSLALTTNIRGFNQFNNFDRSLYRTLTDTAYLPDGNLDLTSNRFNYTAHVWSEISLSYGGVVVEQPEHELKVGVTLRYLGGIGYVGLKGFNLDAHYKTGNDSLFVTKSDLEFASNIISTKSAILNGISNHNILDEFFGAKDGSGIGADLGVVYEYMPNQPGTKSKHDKNGKAYHTKNEYKLRLSASVMDIGAINYKSSSNSNANVTGNGVISGKDFSNNVSNYDEFRNYAVSHGFTADTGHKDTKVYMPTTLRVGADYKIYRSFYVNATFIANLANRQNFGNSYYNQFTVTPRFDTRMISVGLPITYSALASNMKVGIGFRFTGIVVGSDDALGLFSSGHSGFNLYVGGFVPIGKHSAKSKRIYDEDSTDTEPEPDMEHGGSADTTTGSPDMSAVYDKNVNRKTPAATTALYTSANAALYYRERSMEVIDKKEN